MKKTQDNMGPNKFRKLKALKNMLHKEKNSSTLTFLRLKHKKDEMQVIKQTLLKKVVILF